MRRGVQIPWVTWSCRKLWAAQYGWLEPNSGSLEDQRTLLVTETPIQPPVAVLSFSKYFLLPKLNPWMQTTSMESWGTTLYYPQPPMTQATAKPGMKCNFCLLFLIHSSFYMCSWWKDMPRSKSQRISLSLWVSASTFAWLQGVNSNLQSWMAYGSTRWVILTALLFLLKSILTNKREKPEYQSRRWVISRICWMDHEQDVSANINLHMCV